MENKMQVLDQRTVLEKEFTVYGTLENPLFLAKEVSEWIEYGADKTGQMIKDVDDDEKLTATIYRSGQNREMWFLTENGVYEVLMLSHKPVAKQFKKKVKEILKDIRLNGMYIKPEILDNMLSNPDTMIMILTKYRDEKALRIEEQKMRIVAEQKLEEQKPLVEFAETVASSVDSIEMSQFAKLVHDEKIPLGRNQIFDWLRKEGYLRKTNEPYQKFVKAGLFEYIEIPYTTAYGNRLGFKTLVTGKGQIALIEKLKDAFDVA